MGRRGRLSESGSQNPTSSRVSARSVDPSTTPVGGGGPVRTCVGCRRRDDQTQMLRFVVDRGDAHEAGSGLVADPQRRRPGRGAWLHACAECAELAIRRKAFPRALRAPTDIDLSSLTDAVGRLSLASTTRRQGSGL